MEKTWVYKEIPSVQTVEQLSKELNVNPYLSTLLVQRGINTFQEAKDFFRPSLHHLHDPFAMLHMDKAVNRLTEAVFHQEKILIYGDYDVDGTTSVSLMYLFLKHYTSELEFYIPDRYTEGYGVSEKGIAYAHENGFQLIIALDCGIRAVDRAADANKYGIDLIICDHHLPGSKLPDATAILDPKQSGCGYPFKELSGCGVGFKLLEGFCQQNTLDKQHLLDLLDLVAVSISSDIVPIVDENRTLAYYGLKKLNHSPSAGLKSLIELSGKKNPLTVSDVVFTIGPRINAAGRLAHARESVHLLIGDETTTYQSADALNERNKDRRLFDQQITAEALHMISTQDPHQKTTVLFKEDWHKGVIGIVASRCIEHHHRPTIILTESNGYATGSARSVQGFDIYEAISQCDDLLEQFGGHKYAAGLTLKLENLAPFQQRFEEVVSRHIDPDLLIPKIHIDLEVPLSFITFKALSILSQMEPFGPENMSPIFGTKNVVLDRRPQIIKEKHAKGFIRYADGGQLYEFIAFGMAHVFNKVELTQKFDIAYHMEENNYLGNKTLVLNIQDVKIDA